jgi:hypothetical protein
VITGFAICKSKLCGRVCLIDTLVSRLRDPLLQSSGIIIRVSGEQGIEIKFE